MSYTLITEDREDAPCKIGDIATRFQGGRHGRLHQGDSAKVVGFKKYGSKIGHVVLEGDGDYGHDIENLKFTPQVPQIINSYPLY